MLHRLLFLLLLLGSYSGAQTFAPVVRLTLRRAIALALEGGSPDVAVAQSGERIAEARYQEGVANWWPTLEIVSARQNVTRNLHAEGFRFDTNVPGLTIPTSVGPFNTFDARMTLTQTVFDYSALRKSRAARAAIPVAQADTENARDALALQVAHAYAAALRESEAASAIETVLREARATLDSARNKHAAGNGIAIDVTRAEYQVVRQEQALNAARGGRDRAGLALASALGLDFATRIEFEDGLRLAPVEPVAVEQAVAGALTSRGELALVRQREQQLRLNAEAIGLEALPTVAAYADAGALGGVETHTIGVSLRIPVFDGGRRKTRAAEVSAMLQQEQAREAQLRRAIELQIRQADVTMRSAAGDVQATESYVALAQEELAQARRRHDAGVTGATDVIEAETHLAAAARDRVEALFRYTEARIEASYAAGSLRNFSL